MKNEAKFSIFLLFLASLAFSVGIWLINYLGADVVPIMFIGLVAILSTGMTLGFFPRLIPGPNIKVGWIGIAIFFGICPIISLAVKSLGTGLIMGIIAGLTIVWGICVGAFLKEMVRLVVLIRSLRKGR